MASIVASKALADLIGWQSYPPPLRAQAIGDYTSVVVKVTASQPDLVIVTAKSSPLMDAFFSILIRVYSVYRQVGGQYTDRWYVGILTRG